MKKYIIPIAKTIALSEESILMFTASNKETRDTHYFSNYRDEEDSPRSSMWED